MIRLGGGSSGVVYDMGNGKVRKILRVYIDPSRKVEDYCIERWKRVSQKKIKLNVIPYIYDVDYDGYTMDKLEVPCKEGEIISKAINKYLFSPCRKEWKDVNIERMRKDMGDDAEFAMHWLKMFEDDYKTIMGEDAIMSEDIACRNIGKDIEGNVKCFDWFDPYYLNK